LKEKPPLILGVRTAGVLPTRSRRLPSRRLDDPVTYQGDRQKETADELGKDVGAAANFECDVTKDEDIARLAESVRAHGRLDTVVHSIAFANRED